MRNFKTISLLSLLLISAFVNAQDRIREGGISFYNLDHFGLIYRVGKPDALWRFNSMYLGGYRDIDKQPSTELTSNNAGFGVSVGREFRKNLSEEIAFRYGVDLKCSFNRTKTENDYDNTPFVDVVQKTRVWTPGIGGVIGLNYKFREKFLVGAEILPSISYAMEKTSSEFGSTDEITKTESDRFEFHLSSSSIMFTLAYQF